jgi:DNA repair protein RecN (Recombination protein N)
MLAIRSIASKSTGPRTLVFDEIDVGVGGRAAEAVGQRLKSLAETHQVLCVTHQPQIARFADAHFRVAKGVGSGRTHVAVDRLNERGRVEELARMLGGAEITEITRRHARELLRTASAVES